MIIGLTGGMASGKSLVSAHLKGKGLFIVDTDEISRRITQNGEVGAKAIFNSFGNEFFVNGVLDREKLAKTVFAEKSLTQKLNSVLHPLIMAEVKTEINEHANENIILDVPLLFESGFNMLCDKTVTVECDRETRIARAMARSNMSREQILARFSRQLSDEERRQRADYVIENNSSKEQCLNLTDALFIQMLGGSYV